MRLTRTAVNTRLAKLEKASGDQVAGIVALRACSPEGEAAMIAEGERRGEIGPNDLVVTLRSFSGCASEFQPNRMVAGTSRPILVGFPEPPGTPWLPKTAETRVSATPPEPAPVDVTVQADAHDAMRAELERLKAEMEAVQSRQAAAAERAAEQAPESRAVRAFRRVTQADRTPALNLGRPWPH